MAKLILQTNMNFTLLGHNAYIVWYKGLHEHDVAIHNHNGEIFIIRGLFTIQGIIITLRLKIPYQSDSGLFFMSKMIEHVLSAWCIQHIDIKTLTTHIT